QVEHTAQWRAGGEGPRQVVAMSRAAFSGSQHAQQRVLGGHAPRRRCGSCPARAHAQRNPTESGMVMAYRILAIDAPTPELAAGSHNLLDGNDRLVACAARRAHPDPRHAQAVDLLDAQDLPVLGHDLVANDGWAAKSTEHEATD